MTFDPDRDSILPPASTQLEIALEAIGHVRLFELIDVSATLGVLYDIDRVPAELLPWLAWQFGMDVWDANWTEDQQREALRNLPSVMGHRGTKQSLIDAIAPWGAAIEITEWWEQIPQGTPHTFQVNLTTGVADVAAITAAINRVKPLRSHYTLTPGIGFVQAIGVGGVVRVGKLTTISASL